MPHMNTFGPKNKRILRKEPLRKIFVYKCDLDPKKKLPVFIGK